MIKTFHLQELITSFLIEPANLEDMEWIARLEAELYRGNDVVPEEILKEWYAANPTGFFVMKTRNAERVGHIDILPVRPRTLQLFVEGALLERDIRADSLYSPGERDSIRELYIESLAICLPGRSKLAALLSLSSNLPYLVDRIAVLENIESVYAMAATKPGERMMELLGFQIVRNGEWRKDGHPVFSVRFKMLMDNIARIRRDRLNRDAPECLNKR